MAVKIFVDCGAFSLYQKFSKAAVEGTRSNKIGSKWGARRLDDFSYTETDEYADYRRAYIEFIKKNQQWIDCYPNLDVVNNAELTFRNQVVLEDAGVKPSPVWHLGLDEKWLRNYLDEGHPYICLGGFIGESPGNLRPGLDSLWRRVLTDDQGMPRAKYHAFGMTSFELMARYPWYSADSKSWISVAAYGGIHFVPRRTGGDRNWLEPTVVRTAARSMGADSSWHYRKMTKGMQAEVRLYLEEFGVPLGRSSFKHVKPGYEPKPEEQWVEEPQDGKKGLVEVVEEFGVVNHYLARDEVNVKFFTKVEESMPPWPWALPASIKKGRGLFK